MRLCQSREAVHACPFTGTSLSEYVCTAAPLRLPRASDTSCVRCVQERWIGPSSRRIAMKPHRVVALAEHGLVEECALRGDGFRMRDVFNDTSLHTCPLQGLQESSQLFVA